MKKLTIFILFLAGCGAGEAPVATDAGTEFDAGLVLDGGARADAGTTTPTVAFVNDRTRSRTNRIVYGEPISIRAEGLEDGRYTFVAKLWGYESRAEFVSTDGTIDTARDAPVAGTYDGVSADGLVWSMVELRDAPERNFDVTLTVAKSGTDALTAKLVREPMGARANYVRVNETGLVGTLIIPPDVTDPPVVIVLGGSGGGLPEFTAAYLSTFGVAALALGYFGAPGLPSELANIPIEVVDEAIGWLQSRAQIDGTRIAVWGGSRGSELALMAATSTAVRLVIAEAPSDVRWASVNRGDVAAWTAAGAPLPYVETPTTAQPIVETFEGTVAYRFTPMFDAALDAASPMNLEAAEIDVASIAGRVVLIGGGADALWPSCRFARRATERLLAAGHPAHEMHCFGDAGHALGPSGWPTAASYASYSANLRGFLVLGGTPSGTAAAQRAIYDVLARVLGEL